MAYKTLIFGVDDKFNELKPFYDQQIQRGNLEIVAYAIFEQNGIRLVTPDGKRGGVEQLRDVQLAIISAHKTFYDRMKILEAHGFTRNQIIDGRVFQVPELDFPRLLAEGVAYYSLQHDMFSKVSDLSYSIYPKIFSNGNVTLKLGVKSYVSGAKIGYKGIISVDNFSALAWDLIFAVGFNLDHNQKNVGQYGLMHFDWKVPPEFYPKNRVPEISIGSDVWIGMNCTLKCTNPNKPLVIGDGAVVASDSVVVKSVPPYAIVGGNPAQIIKYRFEPHIIESLLRIKWWDWSLDKIHDNFKYFNDIEKFVALHDKT